jgi:hypothetical protein
MKTTKDSKSKSAGRPLYRFYDDPAGGDPPVDETVQVVVKRDGQGRQQYLLQDGKPLFTQDHMNTEIGKARVAARKESENVLGELERLRDSASTSEAVKGRLTEQIDALRQQMVTKEQSLQAELEQWKTKHGNDTQKLTEAAQTFERRWRDQMIATDILTHADKAGAFSAQQVFDLLARNAEVKPRLDEQGNETGAFHTVVTVRDIDPKTKTEKLVTLPADQAIKRMKDVPELYGNLFRPSDKPGTGAQPYTGFNAPPRGGLDFSSPEAYEKSRKGNEHLVTNSHNNG